jgi:hypothetical protein
MASPVGEILAIPWGEPEEWARALRALERLVSAGNATLSPARQRAEGIMEALEEIFPILDALCRATCSRCPDPCCLHAAAYADFRDLLFLTLIHAGHPPGQLHRRPGDTCRFLSRRGCTLPRVQRPWVCTWYLCATQRSALAGWPESDRRLLMDGLEGIRLERRRMEEAFLRAVT